METKNKVTLELLINFLEVAKPKCRTCNREYTIYDLEMYDHPNGELFEDLPQKKWIYFNCKGCTLDYALKYMVRDWTVKKELIAEGVIA